MKRTKILATIAIAATMLSLAGCGNNADSNTSVADVTVDSASAVTETTETPTEEVPETTTAIEETTDEPVTEAPTETPTEAPTEAETEPESDDMTFAKLEDIADNILSGNTDTIEDMVESLSKCGLEFDDENDYSWDGPEFSDVEKYLKTPFNVSDFDGITCSSIMVLKKKVDIYSDTVSFTFSTETSDFRESKKICNDLWLSLHKGEYDFKDSSEFGIDLSSDRFSELSISLNDNAKPTHEIYVSFKK